MISEFMGKWKGQNNARHIPTTLSQLETAYNFDYWSPHSLVNMKPPHNTLDTNKYAGAAISR